MSTGRDPWILPHRPGRRATEQAGRLGRSKAPSAMRVHELEVGLASTWCVFSKLPSATGAVVFRQVGVLPKTSDPQEEEGATGCD